jgi:hypothetical protein
MAIIKIKNQAIDLDAAEIPNLPASKITSGTFTDARIADLAAAKLTGTIATARLGSGTASGTTFLAGDQTYKTAATEFNDDKLVNDISTLALHQATNNNSAKYNLTNSNVDVYQDSSAIANLVNCARDTSGEYISSVVADVGVTSSTIFLVDGNSTSAPFTDLKNSMTGTTNDIGGTSGTPTYNTSNQKWSGYNVLDLNSGTINYGTQYTSYWNGTGNYTIEFWFKNKGTMSDRERYWCFGNDSTNGQISYGVDYSAGTTSSFNLYANTVDYDPSGNFTHTRTDTAWRHFRYVRNGSDSLFYFDGNKIATYSGGNATATMNQKFRISGRPVSNGSGSEFFDAYYTDFIISNSALSTGASYTLPSAKAVVGSTSATANYQSTAQIANASVNKISGVVTYTNASGTATLNTDIILQVSADNGSNYTNATLTPAGSFSSGVLQAVTNDISVTAGTQLKYKIFFANQSSGSKVTRINGVSLSY